MSGYESKAIEGYLFATIEAIADFRFRQDRLHRRLR